MHNPYDDNGVEIDLKEATDDAIALFANKNAREEIIIGSYDEHLAKFEAAAADLFAIVQTPDAVDDLPDENAQAAFVKAFRDLIRIPADCGSEQCSERL